MDEDWSTDPAHRRRRLLLPTSCQTQTQNPPQTQPPLPMDLASQYNRRFAPSLFLPPMAPRLASSSGFSVFSNYQSPPTLVPTAAGAGSHLARSLPKLPLFSMDSLGLLPYSTNPAAGAAVPRSLSSPGGSEQQVPSASGLPPRGAGHRRSRSDFLVGFSRPNQLSLPMTPAAGEYRSREASVLEELFRSYRDPNLSSSGDNNSERNDHLGRQLTGQGAWSPGDSSDNDAESWAASGSAAAGTSASHSHTRHCRSLSVDSIMGNLNFGGLGQVSLRLPPPSPVAGAGGSLSRAGSGASGGAVATASSQPANGEFSESEMKKIMANDRLAELALVDPRRVKRILANRISAAKSKERKVKYMGELERKVRVLQMETSTLSSKAASSQRECEALRILNNEMKIRLQAMEQQAQLKDALNEALTAEVQRLKQIAGEASDPHVPNMSRKIVEQQLQKQPSEAQLAEQQQPQESEEFKAQQKQWNH
ncbi:Transcription factor VIP1 [Zea mays]|uniref:BZIP transcription factor n=2 Tax=Zea mays TaxID=4577 RepID=C4JAX3_MAIZE|eukprot:NP_001183793.1 putative bZIP transcription factor superfamily protein [Zea mays]